MKISTCYWKWEL